MYFTNYAIFPLRLLAKYVWPSTETKNERAIHNCDRVNAVQHTGGRQTEAVVEDCQPSLQTAMR